MGYRVGSWRLIWRQGTPKDAEGKEIVRQFSILNGHRREQIYDVSGNHDRNGLDEPQGWWWRKWVDPTGEHPEFSQVHAEKRPFPIEGTWERYWFRAGNLLFLMMSDINEPTQKTWAWKTRWQSGGCSERRDIQVVEGNGRTESRLHNHHRSSLRPKEYDGCVGGMGRDGTDESRRVGYGLPRIFQSRNAARCVISSLGGQQAGLWRIRKVSGRHSRASGSMARRAHTLLLRTRRRKIVRRNSLRHDVHQCSGFEQVPDTTGNRNAKKLASDIHRGKRYRHSTMLPPRERVRTTRWYPKVDRKIKLKRPFSMPAAGVSR